MRIRLQLVPLVVALAVVAGCDREPTGGQPVEWTDTGDGLSLEVSLPREILPAGEVDTLTMRLTNLTAQPIRLDFGSTCQVLPFIETETGAVAYPGGGAWGCGAMLTTLTVPASSTITRTLVVRPAAQGTTLPPGRYRAYATVDARPNGPSLRSAPVAFEVR